MREKEQRLWDRMRKNKPALVALHRVENMLDAGFPDLIAKHKWGRATWLIELKAVHEYPKREKTPVFGDEGLDRDQRNWFMLWHQAQGDCLIVCSVGEGADLMHYCIPGWLHDEFNLMTRSDLITRALFSGRGDVFWDTLWDHIAEDN